MSKECPTIADVRGARGSNAGDQFHELWVLGQILTLLVVGTNLKAVTVESVIAPRSRPPSEGPTWDGVDCALFFGGASFATAERVEFAQLKYSSDPNRSWSIARLTANRAKRVNNSVLRKLADDFQAARERMRPDATLRLRFVSNQPVLDEVQTLSDAVVSRTPLIAPLDKQLAKVTRATGLGRKDLEEFLRALDFSECGRSSRFVEREGVACAVANLIEDNATSDTAHLQQSVRELMLPERHGEPVTRQIVLSWFGIADESGLFPSPHDIVTVDHPVVRDVSKNLAQLLLEGSRLVCLHGPGGCGKTTVMQQLPELLPEGSCFVLFDCFGGGRYLFSDDERHLPRHAFLQILNDIALTLRTPLLLAPGNRHPVDVRQFLRRLSEQATVLAGGNPEAMLVVAVDAADNAVAAAQRAGPSEPCFVRDLCDANLAELPTNVRIVLTARSARLGSLDLPSYSTNLECKPFSRPETGEYVRGFWPDVSDAWVEQFHHLSDGVPRVQDYAVKAADDPQIALNALRPGGKKLAQILEQLFETALSKIGSEQMFTSLIAGLAVLPPPIPSPHLAAFASTDSQTVVDLAHDLAPGLRVGKDGISIADEDFEVFIHERSSQKRSAATADAAAYLLQIFRVDSYAATHVAAALLAADRGRELLQLIQDDPQVEALDDPIARQEVRVQRSRLALRACRSTGGAAEALKVILTSADASEEEYILRDILERHSDLAVNFAWPSLRRLVLADSDSVRRQGTVLAQDAGRAARIGDHITARERLDGHDAWLRRWANLPDNERSQWELSVGDIAARAEATLELEGAEAVVKEIKRWRPEASRIEVALKLIPRLLAAGKQGNMKDALDRSLLPEPWNLLLSVPLALAGASVDASTISASLSTLTPGDIRMGVHSSRGTKGDPWEHSWFQLLVTACELAVHLSVDQAVVRKALHLLRGELWPHPAYWVPLSLDALVRVWLLQQHLDGSPTTSDALIASLESDRSSNGEPRRPVGKEQVSAARDSQYDELTSNLRALLPIYVGRLKIITNHDHVPDEEAVARAIPGGPKDNYSFDRNFRSRGLREDAAISVMQLMVLPGVPWPGVLERASAILYGGGPGSPATWILPLLEYLLVRRDAHARVLETVTQNAKSVQDVPLPSSEKINAIIRFSRLLLRVSVPDAECLFSSVVELAGEVDREAYDQIESLSNLSECSPALTTEERHDLAAKSFHFVSGAAERLSNYEQFPWEAAVTALARLSFPIALSAVAMWVDRGAVDLHTALRPLLAEAVTLQDLPSDAAAALAILLDEPNTELSVRILAEVQARGPNLNIAEELAWDCLLHAPQANQLAMGREILSRVDAGSVTSSAVLTQLSATVNYLNSLPPLTAGTSRPTLAVAPANDSDCELEEDAQLAGLQFTSADAIQGVLERSDRTMGSPSPRDVLTQMRRLTSVSDRVPFLNALVDVDTASIREDERAEALLEALRAWGDSLALERWRRQTLPEYIVLRFADLAPRLMWESTLLTDLLAATGISDEDRARVLTKCVEAAGTSLSSRLLRTVAAMMAKCIPTADAAGVLAWYVDRLGSRVPIEIGPGTDTMDVSATGVDAIGRFLFALLADIDTRLRWRVAHAVRRLARLGATDFLDAVVSNWSRTADNAFRDPGAPYYWLSARLWLAMTLNRISAEVPTAVVPHLPLLLRAATDPDLPHILIREHAKQAALRLTSNGDAVVAATDIDSLRAINEPRLPRTDRERAHGSDYRSDPRPEQAFHFDLMDTLPYLYRPLLRLFPDIEMDDLLSRAEHWIVANWAAPTTAGWWQTEPRKARYDERRYGLWTPSHGELPTIERYGYYLEWNAMMCVVGELLTTHAVTNAEEGFSSFERWFARLLPTEPDYWVSDVREPTPLVPRLWGAELPTAGTSAESPLTGELAEEMGVNEPTHPGWIVVAGQYDVHLPSDELHTAISSALVSPGTASALARALQTAADPNDFRLPDEGDEVQIDAPPYRLMGWLGEHDCELGFDERDPLRHQAVPVRVVPGHSVEMFLGLNRDQGAHATWTGAASGEQAFIAEVWNDLSEDDSDRRTRQTGSGGWRLWTRASDLRAFLSHKDMDLICEVNVVSRSYEEGSRRYDSEEGKPGTRDRILLIRRDGWIDGATGRIGTW